ncbi:hypothetical protein ACFP81_11955 [Deinococcus lacus]|uniref:Uncharacterized protein n=1 Tax=Deinococcus lacus TaxID=392561 RepID=A0ABW1YEC8_9DEIO
MTTQIPNSPVPLAPKAPERTPARNVGFLGRLSVPQKVGLVTAALALPLLYFAGNNVVQQQRQLANVNRQLLGYQYLQPFQTLLRDVQLTRGVTIQTLQNKQGFKRTEPYQNIGAIFEQLNQLGQTQPLSEDVTKRIAEVQGIWRDLETALASNNPHGSAGAHYLRLPL